MPAEGLLQRFHDLAEVDEEVRCRAAVGVREDLTGSTNDDDLQYTLRRLVRGVQSSRQCCRQGFSLALSEVLAAFPGELSRVLDLIRQHTELQVGLKHSEMKDRLLGRLFSYAAVLQADCLKSCTSSLHTKKGKESSSQGSFAELGKGLHEIFVMRPYLKAPSARMVADVVAELVAGGLVARVPELLAPWALEEKAATIISSDSAPDVYIVGLLLELRSLYTRAEQAGSPPDALQSWPACIRKDALAKPPYPEGLAQAVGKELASAPLNDGMSWVAGPFCNWWLQASKQKENLHEQVWPKLHGLLFPEKATPIAEAQGFRALAELASRLHEAGLVEAKGANGTATLRAESLLAGLFQNMPRGLTLLFRSLNWQKAQTHPAAVFAQNSLVKAVGAPVLQPSASGKKRKENGANESGATDAALPMTDETRLAILGVIQRQKAFGTMNGKYQRMWQQALLAPLSSEGVRSRCTSLLESLMAGVEENDLSKKRLYADQLVQLATHGQAPDEVVLAALCLLLTESYFTPAGPGSEGHTFSMKKFRKSVGLDITCSGEDLVIPVLGGSDASATSAGDDEDNDTEKKRIAAETYRKQWQLKLWSALTGLCRRMSPEQAAKLAAAANAAGDDSGVRTFAYHGCLSDGSLWAMRMHEWWDHIVTNTDAQASPRLAPKKKRKAEKGLLQCIVNLSDKDMSLRKRCLDCCRAVLAEPESEESLPKRQRNALCGLPLVLALALLEDENDKEAEDPLPVRDHLEELIDILEKLPSTSSLPEAPKQRAKALATLRQERAKVLAEVPLVAAELFVQSNRLVKEAARATWRELSEFTSDETLTSLCASVRDAVEDEEDEAEKGDAEGSGEEDEDEEEGDEKISAAAAAKIARLNKATQALKEARAAESAEQPSKGDDDDDEIILDGEAVWEQLLDDGGGGESGLLTSFASSGLDGAEAMGNKLSKRQQRLRHRQEELMKKFREVELLELFVQKCAEKRPVVAQLLQDLYDGLLSAGRRAGGSQEQIGGNEEDSVAGKAKKKTKANSQLQRMEKELMLRLAGVLSKVLKQVCRGHVIAAACQWHSAVEWRERAQALVTLSSSASSSAAGQRPVEVGAVLLYWICALHRARSTPSGVSESTSWELGDEMLRGALQDWGGKKGSDKWCQAFLGAFAVRVPEALLRLPWAEHIRSSRNMFVQREQILFVTNQLLRGLSAEVVGGAQFTASFAELCADLLDSTLESSSSGASASQRTKMRRELLRCLVVLLKARHRKSHRHQSNLAPPAISDEIGRKIIVAIKKVRDSLSHRRGEVYQLCLHVLRALNSPKKEGGSAEDHGRTATPAKRDRVDEIAEGSEVAEKKSGKRSKTSGGAQTSKGSKGFFGDM
mmetsp:Transcript_2525/g.3906  ORF Transcript_2525/g.3906 Transcript_2525/m.3906 type:complete len:1368 (-) Transcript_2525:36-4139(-)